MSIFTDRVDSLKFLKELEQSDNFGFLQNINGNWDNHRIMLLMALELTDGPVLELGSGEGSTPYLSKYCILNRRTFQSFDNNKEWCEKTGAEYVVSWGAVVAGASCTHHGLIFIDHAPGERRYSDTIRLANAASIIVLHDTEERGAGNYMWDKVWPHFKFRLNHNKTGGGAGASAVSNVIDLSRFRGLSLGNYKFDND